MNIYLRLLVPAALLGAVLLLGERPANPPDEAPAVEFASAADHAGHADLGVPCPGLVPGRPLISPLSVRLPPAAADRLKADAPPPETRSLSPPGAV